ncbi:hypothetical protein [Streptomyces graminilatus]|uniref:hypothetical protein n=1 Tax=Streptomyces graminilatus TaxID=1464070 RepID=UPI001F5245DF|nr:hypothetical protein [Streptomyces graminilatus]
MTDATPGPAPFKIGFTLKAASGYDAEWLTPSVWGHTAEETAKRGAELLGALKSEGLIDLNAKAAEYTRGQFRGGAGNPGGGSAPKKFQGGKVQPKKPAVADDDCPHGRNLVEKANWAALFCNSQDDSDKCEPLWRQKDGSFKAR